MKDKLFIKMVDDIVEFADSDPELKIGIKWIDELAQKNNVTFYDQVYEVLLKQDVQCKAKQWLKEKTSIQ